MEISLMTPNYIEQAVLNKSRLDKFELILNLPKCFKFVKAKSSRIKEVLNLNYLQFSIYSAPTPQISVPSVDMPFAGQTTKISSHARPPMPPLSVNFAIDNRYTNWWVIWKWLDMLNGAVTSTYNPPESAPRSNHTPGTLDDYATNITIYGLDEFNRRVVQFDYLGAFVTDLTEIGYNNRNPEEIDATFTMQYSQFKAEILDENF